ncbi:MAG: AzlD domain-containing protein [Anaerolineae bacterium]|jgi:branched-subunit amino acid transport protein|nr:AzlD domain-containing protein [Anaerolineae bacterium]
MTDQTTVFLTIVGMLAVTYLPRVLPLWLFSSRSLPPLVIAWLRYVPVAVLAAMVLPSLVLAEDRITLGGDNLFFWAAFPTFIVAWRTKSLFAAVLVGMGVVAGARAVIGIG